MVERDALRQAIVKLLTLAPRLHSGLFKESAPCNLYEVVSNSTLFDRNFYIEANPDVQAAGMDPVHHYLAYGCREGRDPSPLLSERAFREKHPDVAGAGTSAVVHYELHGWKDHGRLFLRRYLGMLVSRNWRGGAIRANAKQLRFASLSAVDGGADYYEIAPSLSTAPIAPSFVFGPFPEYLTQSYFGDLTTLSVGCFSLRDVGLTSHSLLIRDGAVLLSDQLSMSHHSVFEANGFGPIDTLRPFSRWITDEVVSLAGPGHLIYGHWLVDFLPKLYIIAKLELNKPNTKYILPSNTPKFVFDWLEVLGISKDRIVFFDPYSETVGVRKLLVPTLLRTNSRTHPIFRQAVDYLCSLMPPGIRDSDGPRHLYLTRGHSGPENRKLLNRAALERVAVGAGYSVIRPETLSIKDQIALLSHAKSLVGEYGSALHGSIFCSAEAVVCALRSSARHPGFLQSGLCQAMKQNIGYVMGEAGEFDVQQEFTVVEENFNMALRFIELLQRS